MCRPNSLAGALAVLFVLFFAEVARADAAATFPIRVDEIRIEGLVRTKPFVVRREIGFHEGDVITEHDYELAITRLWNTTIFAHVDAAIVHEGARTIVVYTLEDRWTLNPLFSFGSGGNASYFTLGAADNNLAGRFLEAQARYQWFEGFSGGQIILHDPRLFDQRMELFVTGSRLTRPRPGFSDEQTLLQAELDRYASEDRVRYGVRASFLDDSFLEPLDGDAFYPDPTKALLVEPSFRLGRVDTVRLRQRGASFEVRPGAGFFLGSRDPGAGVPGSYAQATAEALGFLMLGERWNLAARLHAAGVSSVPPHLQIYAGGLDLVRGFPDNYIRTRALALVNLEARFTAFDSTWVALMPVAFFDAAAARSPSGSPGAALAAGLGLRGLVPKFVGTGIRADVGVPLFASLRDVSAAEQTRFGPATPPAHIPSLQVSFGVYQFF